MKFALSIIGAIFVVLGAILLPTYLGLTLLVAVIAALLAFLLHRLA